jgi:hypothetical protein
MDLLGNLLFAADIYFGHHDRSGRLFQIRKRLCEERQRRSPFTAERAPAEPPSLTAAEATGKEFREASRNFRDPVVIRGLLAGTRAVRTWSTSYFTGVCGDAVYPVIADTRREDATVRRSEFRMSTIRDMMAGLEQGRGYEYINNLTSIFVEHPHIVDDLELPRLLTVLDHERSDACFEAVNLFIGGKGTGSNFHQEFAGNFFALAAGRKVWWMIEPRYTPYMLPIPAHPFFFSDSYFDPLHETNGTFTRRLPSLRVVLEPGDVLYMAPWWWHSVRNLDTFTAGCAVRYGRLKADFLNAPLSTVLSQEYRLYLLKAYYLVLRSWRRGREGLRAEVHRRLDNDIFFQDDDTIAQRPGSTPARLVEPPPPSHAPRKAGVPTR